MKYSLPDVGVSFTNGYSGNKWNRFALRAASLRLFRLAFCFLPFGRASAPPNRFPLLGFHRPTFFRRTDPCCGVVEWLRRAKRSSSSRWTSRRLPTRSDLSSPEAINFVVVRSDNPVRVENSFGLNKTLLQSKVFSCIDIPLVMSSAGVRLLSLSPSPVFSLAPPNLLRSPHRCNAGHTD